MRPTHRTLILFTALALSAPGSQGQSLGDVARQQRQKQQAQAKEKAAAEKKVITNEDLPQHSEPEADPADAATESKPADSSPQPPSSDTKAAGEQWKSRILAQKNGITSLKSQIEKLDASIHFVQANLYTNGVEYNQYQQRKQQQLKQMQAQLLEEQQKLEEMQEAARKAGFGNAIYDP